MTFKLKKKIQKTKKGHWLWCINLNPKKVGESCLYDADCYSFNCVKRKCEGPETLRKVGEYCLCDFHCETGHCSLDYWFIDFYHKCTED